MADIEDLSRVLGELTHPELPNEPDALAELAAVGLTLHAWRNTHLEKLHAGDHPSGGFEDSDMPPRSRQPWPDCGGSSSAL